VSEGRRTADVIDAYVRSRYAAGCSAKYEAWLRYTLGFLARAFEELPATAEQIDEVSAGLPVRLSEQTRRDVWNGMRLLYRWASGRLGVPDATERAERPRRPRKKVLRTLTDDEMDRIFWANRRYGRDLAMVRLILDTGLRLGELSGLTWDDLTCDGPNRFSLRVTGKCGERRVPVSAETVGVLRALRSGQRAVWVGQYGPLEKSGVQCAVRRVLRRASVDGGPHMLRHTFADHYVRNNGDVFSLQLIMGHENIETTYRYVHLNNQHVQERHAKFSPMAGRGQSHQLRLLGEETGT